MTAPAPLTWPLAAGDVRGWLRLVGGEADDDLLERCAASASIFVQRARPDAFLSVVEGEPPVFVPDDEIYTAGLALAARLYRRRLSPEGMQQFGDQVMYSARFDPDVERGLRQGRWAMPGVG